MGDGGRRPLECVMKRQEALQPPLASAHKTEEENLPIPDLLLLPLIRSIYCPCPTELKDLKERINLFPDQDLYKKYMCLLFFAKEKDLFASYGKKHKKIYYTETLLYD